MKVVALHKLPFDSDRFEAEVARMRFPELREQIQENWENAWIIVVEHDGEIDFARFCEHPDDQAPWLEQLLDESGPNGRRAAFFMHYVDPARPLRYAGADLPLPPPTEPTAGFVRQMQYETP